MNRPHAWNVRTADYILQNASPEGYHPRLEKKWAYVSHRHDIESIRTGMGADR